MPRLATVPAAEIRHVLGLEDHHCHEQADWLKVVAWESVTDARGRPVEDCVFCDTETGLVVVREGAPGRYPLRCEGRPAPLTVKGT